VKYLNSILLILSLSLSACAHITVNRTGRHERFIKVDVKSSNNPETSYFFLKRESVLLECDKLKVTKLKGNQAEGLCISEP